MLLFSCIILLISLYHPYDHDEFEHIHSAWYVKNGFQPYTDFFEHHHSLFWYCLVPFLAISGETVTALFVIRGLMFILTLGMGWIIYMVTTELTKSKREGWLSVLFLFTMVLFVQKSIEVRPDVPQVFFSLLSLWKFIRFMKSQRKADFYLSAFFASISFVFLQKAIFYLVALALFLLWMLARKKISIRQIIVFCFVALIPLGCYLMFLYSQGALGDYFVTNWTFNLNRGVRMVPTGILLISLLENTLFWMASLLALFTVLRKKLNARFHFILWIIAVYTIFVFFVIRPWAQYLLLPIALLSVLCASVMMNYFEIMKSKKIFFALLLILFFISPAISYIVRIGIGNRNQREVIQYVLEQTEKEDRVFDGDSHFNLFRHDLHYFWFDCGFYNKNWQHPKEIEERLSNFDIPQLIQDFQPEIISDYKLNVSSNPVFQSYRKTGHRLFIKMNYRKPENQVELYKLEKKE